MTCKCASIVGVCPVEYYADGTGRSVLTEGDDNAKFGKSAKGAEVYQVGVTMAPATESGYDVCAYKSAGCSGSCLNTTPRNTWDTAKLARIRRTLLVLVHPTEAKAYIARDLARCARKCHKNGWLLAIRLNTMSDLAWERLFAEIFKARGEAQFLDYTKNPDRYWQWLGQRRADPYKLERFAKNYHLTFSRSELNEDKCRLFLHEGGTCTIVVRTEADRAKLLANGYKGFPCINGDLHDRRWEDKPGHWVVLIAKGKAKTDTTGFVVDCK